MKGIYLILNPASPRLLAGLAAVLETGTIGLVQIWDHWPEGLGKAGLVSEILALCRSKGVPVLANNDVKLLEEFALDGVHLDHLPGEPLVSFRKKLPPKAIIGLTLGNDLSALTGAEAHQLDYVSFCSVFPSGSAGVCEIVSRETISKARSFTELPIFLAGGINATTISSLRGLAFDGVAVVSGIMGSENPAAEALTIYGGLGVRREA
ncbi:hypothetical protein GCM10023091_21710 [Ravibacter arvi]|uniref:Thiamine phosphate synthase/TenI domain-containing protein n=1 Tax=Ravibacter arvi TaxID=2051041 RepID=A0ABP8M025_9BACT